MDNKILFIISNNESLKIIDKIFNDNLELIILKQKDNSNNSIALKYKVISSDLTKESIISFIIKNNIEKVVDLSDIPTKISINAMEACKECNRELLKLDSKKNNQDYNKFISIDSLKDVIPEIIKSKMNLLITNEINDLDKIIDENESAADRVFLIVEPTIGIIEKSQKMGCLEENLLAIKGRLSKDLYKEIFKYYRINRVLINEFNNNEIIKAAEELGIKMFIIKEKKIDYSARFSDLDELISYILQKNFFDSLDRICLGN